MVREFFFYLRKLSKKNSLKNVSKFLLNKPYKNTKIGIIRKITWNSPFTVLIVAKGSNLITI